MEIWQLCLLNLLVRAQAPSSFDITPRVIRFLNKYLIFDKYYYLKEEYTYFYNFTLACFLIIL